MSRLLSPLPGCWRQIGVEGDRSCAELSRVIQCRNCQVFSDEAAHLFERPAPPDYLASWTRTLRENVSLRRLAGRSNRVFAGICLFLGELTLAVSLRGLLGLGPPQAQRVRWVAISVPSGRWVFDIDELIGVVRYRETVCSGAPAAGRTSVVT
ncbi:MAG: hypothetical protein RMJ98_19335 [Myxococcales bacterium]|nr:hypothetical protein [Polyangiaceae bacterium]MDW8251454.1 hypothetical protein [Myxococcales bacterium]